MRRNFILIGLSLAGFILQANHVRAGEDRYLGLCEASAAAVVDEDHFAVASDDSEKIRIYQRGHPEPLPNVFRHEDVTDLEASARIDGTILWLTSHSLNKNGKDKSERKELFATTVGSGPSLVETGSTYRQLREDIAAAINGQDPSFIKSFNIEGLASTPAKTILVGLRGPTDEKQPGRAYVVEISNPLALVGIGQQQAAHASIANVFHLKLFDADETTGRGVRSIERVGERYLIVAGSVPDGKRPAPRLFWWNGKDENNVVPAPAVNFSEMVPEAMIAWSAADVQIFGDNGDAVIDGKPCDDKHDGPAGAWFPSIDLGL